MGYSSENLSALEVVSMPSTRLRHLAMLIVVLSLIAGCDQRKHVSRIFEATNKVIRMGGDDLRVLPPELQRCKSLQELWITSSRITDIPTWISEMRELRVLKIQDSRLRGINPAVFTLPRLEELGLALNRIEVIPAGVPPHPHLTSVNLNFNRIREIPDWLLACPKLKTLQLVGNQVNQWPKTSPCGVEVLIATNNEISFLPSAQSFPSLKQLRVDINQIACLKGISGFQHLEFLSVCSNQIQALPDEMGEIEHLRYLDVSNNPISVIPDGMVEGWRDLRELRLSCTRVESLPRALLTLEKLELIALTGTPVPNDDGVLRDLRDRKGLQVRGP